MKRRSFICGGTLLALTGCSLGPRPAAQPALFDFGIEPPAPSKARLHSRLALAEVTSAASLRTTAIVYRLAYRNASQLQPYSLSRWAAPPAVLMTHRLQLVLSQAAEYGASMVADGVRSDHILKVELDAFEQMVDSPEAARAIVSARASLIDGSDRRVLAHHLASIERPCRSVDAEGAVSALSEAAGEWIAQLIDWVAARTERS